MRNYLALLFRNFQREKLYTTINLAGLSLGVACCLVLGLFLKSELTYDQHFEGHERIYRVVNEFTTGGTSDKFSATSQALGPDDGRGLPGGHQGATCASAAAATGAASRCAAATRCSSGSTPTSPTRTCSRCSRTTSSPVIRRPHWWSPAASR